MEKSNKLLRLTFMCFIICLSIIITAQSVPLPASKQKRNNDWTTLSYGKLYDKKHNQLLIGFPLISCDSTLSKEIVYNMFLSKDIEYEYFKIVGIEKEEYEKMIKQFK